MQEAVPKASGKQTVRGDLISDNEAGLGQAAVRLGSKRLAGGSEVDDLLLRLTPRDSVRMTSRVRREDDDLDARLVAESFKHRGDAAVEGGGVRIPECDQRLDIENDRSRAELGDAVQHLLRIVDSFVAGPHAHDRIVMTATKQLGQPSLRRPINARNCRRERASTVPRAYRRAALVVG